jgi:hypothetical protein
VQTRAKDVRSVAIVPASATSCSVLYQTSTASPAMQLRHCQAHPDRCAAQAQRFLKKLESMGIACAAARR